MSIARSSSLFAFGTLISRVTGLFRDTIVASVFGASALMDAFLVANRIPNLFRDMLAEGALGTSFTKVYSSLATEDPKRAQKLLVDAFRLSFILMLLFTAIGIVAAPLLVKLFTAYSNHSERGSEFYVNAVGLTRVMFPFLGLATLAAIAMGVLQQRGRFFLVAVAPIALNVGYVIGALVFAKILASDSHSWLTTNLADGSILGLALGVLLGGLLHFLVQFYALWRDLKDLDWHASSGLITKDLTKVFILMAPAAVASSAGSLNLLINTNFATSLETGSVTWLNYAFRLLQLPIGLFGVAIGAATLPALTRSIVNAGHRVDGRASVEIQTSLELIVWLMMACFLFLSLNDEHLINLFYGYGAFDQNSVRQTADALYAYSFGVMGYGMGKVLTSIYFALDRTKYAMRASLIAVGINFTSNYFMIGHYGHVGLAAAASVSTSCNALILVFGLRHAKIQFEWPKLFKSLALLTIACVLVYAAQKFCLSWLGRLDLMPAGINGKAEDALATFLSGFLIFAVFAGLSFIRLGWSAADALRQIKNFKNRIIK